MMTEMFDSVLDWLTEDENPSVRYRTLTELMGLPPDHPDVMDVREKIPTSKVAQTILGQIGADGTWPWIAGYDSPEYGFSYLGELGLDHSHPMVALAADTYLGGQLEDGNFFNSYFLTKGRQVPDDESCYYALTLRGFLKLGYGGDPRVRKAIDYVLTQSRWDGGYLCTKSYVKPGTRTKSCLRGSKNVLLLFSELPELWESPQCKALVDYFLERKLFYKRDDPARMVKPPRTFFPFHYRYGILELLLALSRMGYGRHPALEEGWQALEDHRDESGRYVLDWTMPKCDFKVGKADTANKWVTLYARLALKSRGD